MSKRSIHGKDLVFDDKQHRYYYNDVVVPSVTTILNNINKPVLIPWAVKMTSDYWLECMKAGQTDLDEIYKKSKSQHYQQASKAASIGTNVHDYAECYFKKLPLPKLKTKAARNSGKAFHKWIEEHKVEVMAVERRVYSKEYTYAGTCDLIAKIDGVLAVIDYKTSSGIYPEMLFQTAAYQHAIQEEKNIKIEIRWIVRFDKKTGEFEAKSFTDFESDFAGFKGTLELHKALKKIQESNKKKK